MAELPGDQRFAYPLAASNFRVTVDGATMRFARVSGLQRQHQTVTYRHGLSFAEGELIAKHRVDTYGTVTLEQGAMIGSRDLHEWLERRTPVAMEVSLCDVDGLPVIGWRIARALAVKLTGPSFDAKSNEVAIDALELKAAGISIVHY